MARFLARNQEKCAKKKWTLGLPWSNGTDNGSGDHDRPQR